MIHNEDELPKRQPYTEDRDEDEDEEPYEGEEGGGSLQHAARGGPVLTRSQISVAQVVMARYRGSTALLIMQPVPACVNQGSRDSMQALPAAAAVRVNQGSRDSMRALPAAAAVRAALRLQTQLPIWGFPHPPCCLPACQPPAAVGMLPTGPAGGVHGLRMHAS
jgi:hypothetical protein